MESFSINNTESFRQLYSRYDKALMLYAMKMTEDEETAEDIVQNVFLHLWENREIFDDENVVRNFLYLSVRRRAIDHARHVKVEGKYKEYALGNDEATEAAWEDSEAFKSEIYRRLMEAINELPPRQREIFLHYMQGKKNTEIAQMMNISEETIRVQRKRALKTLRKKVGDKYIIFLLFL